MSSEESVTGSQLLLVYDHTPVDDFRALMSFICEITAPNPPVLLQLPM